MSGRSVNRPKTDGRVESGWPPILLVPIWDDGDLDMQAVMEIHELDGHEIDSVSGGWLGVVAAAAAIVIAMVNHYSTDDCTSSSKKDDDGSTTTTTTCT